MAGICPLLLIAGKGEECVEEKCAWWHRSVIPQRPKPKIIEMCSILKIAKSLKYPQK